MCYLSAGQEKHWKKKSQKNEFWRPLVPPWPTVRPKGPAWAIFISDGPRTAWARCCAYHTGLLRGPWGSRRVHVRHPWAPQGAGKDFSWELTPGLTPEGSRTVSKSTASRRVMKIVQGPVYMWPRHKGAVREMLFYSASQKKWNRELSMFYHILITIKINEWHISVKLRSSSFIWCNPYDAHFTHGWHMGD